MSKYKLTSPKIKGHIIADYVGGNLRSLEFVLDEPLTIEQWNNLTLHIPHTEAMISGMNTIKAVKLVVDATNVKIAMFCEMYEKHTNIKYKVSGADAGKMKKITITSELLKSYFTSDNFLFKGKQTIANLAKYYNELLLEMNNPKGKFPNKYDRDYERKLASNQLSEYWQHLRSIGLKPHKNHQGQVVDWK